MNDGKEYIRPTEIRCVRCGYDLSGTPLGGVCPECGATVVESVRPAMPGGRKKLPAVPNATPCLIVGLVSFCIPILAPIGVLLYFSARRQAASGDYEPGTMGSAIAGLVLSLIAGGLWGMSLIEGYI